MITLEHSRVNFETIKVYRLFTEYVKIVKMYCCPYWGSRVEIRVDVKADVVLLSTHEE